MLAECLVNNCSHFEMQGEFGRGVGTTLRTISEEVENGVPGVRDSKENIVQRLSLGQHPYSQGKIGKKSHRELQC